MVQYAAQAIGDRQAQAEAFFSAGLVAVQTLELLENHLLFVLRDARAAIPYFQAQLALVSAYAQQYWAVGIAERIRQKVLQNASQQLDVTVDPQMTAAQAEAQALFLGQCLEFGTECVEQFVEHERLALRVDLAVFQARDVQQVADQVFGGTQRAVQVLHQLPGFARQAVVLVGEGGGEQACSVQRLHQVMADRCKKAGLRLVRGLG